MNRQELLDTVKKIDNISKYSIKGGTSMFNREYPNLLNVINAETVEMQTYAQNKKLVAKLLFLKEYDGDINKLTIDNKPLIYDYKLNTFKVANLNAATIQWNVCKNELSSINNFYSKEETIKLFGTNYSQYFGKSGNRRLLRDDKKLYLSLYKHTSNMDNLNKNLNKFSSRLYILMNDINIYCETHGCLKFWKFTDNKFTIVCDKCEPNFPSKEWFRKKYGDDWEKYFNKRKQYLSNLKIGSLGYYINKYGVTLGEEKYRESTLLRLSSIAKQKTCRCSKISQDLFWRVYEKLENKENVYFHDLNHEYVESISKEYNYSGVLMLHDFKQNNKIIEYNGIYWHNDVKDNIRYNILKKMGYDILVVTSDEYDYRKKSNEIIEKCVKFLSCK